MCYSMKALKKITKSLLNASSFMDVYLPEYSAQHQTDVYATIAYGIQENYKIDNRSNMTCH